MRHAGPLPTVRERARGTLGWQSHATTAGASAWPTVRALVAGYGILRPPLGRRARAVAYIVALTAAIFGALASGTAQLRARAGHAPRAGRPCGARALVARRPRVGRPLGRLPGAGRVLDRRRRALLLGAPLPRRGLAVRPLRAALARGAAPRRRASAAVVLVGLSGRRATAFGAARAAGRGAVGLAAARRCWASPRRGAVQALGARASARSRRLTWAVARRRGGAARPWVRARSHGRDDDALLWSGPWGWAVRPASSAGAVAGRPRGCSWRRDRSPPRSRCCAAICDGGTAPTERHVRPRRGARRAPSPRWPPSTRGRRGARWTSSPSTTGRRAGRAAWLSAQGRPHLLLRAGAACSPSGVPASAPSRRSS